MFDNIGSKIKTLAKVVCWIGIIASVIIGFILLVQDEDTVLAGLLTMILGSLGSWIGSFMTYGFGQLIENSDILVSQNKTIGHQSFHSNSTSNEQPAHTWRCSGCGNMISDTICPHCGKTTDSNAEKINTLNKWKAEGLITEEEYNKKMETLK